MKNKEFSQTAGKLPWHIKPTRKKNPVSAIIYDAEGSLVAACAYGNAKLIVDKVNGTPTPEEDPDSKYLTVCPPTAKPLTADGMPS
ncbi:MAG: hypothetical protein J6Q22_11150 [Prevotella sp.]|nr:hypothetical protein [Prevotella sp.]